MIIRRTRFLLLILLAFSIGGGAVYSIFTFSSYSWYGVKQKLGLQSEVIFLGDNRFGASEQPLPTFEGHEVFPTSNNDTIDPGSIPQRITPVPRHGKVIVANLDQMKLFLYDDGTIEDEFTIHSKGVSKSLWDVPPGEYTVQYKSKEYFSPVADTWMPYTVQFFNDFYIHGWPKYTDGSLVNDDFVAGAIRLSTKDARDVYEFAQIGADIVVVSSVPSQYRDPVVSGTYSQKDDGKYLPNLASRSYLVADIDTGQVILEYRSDRVYPIASISKLMTALVSLEVYDQLEDTTVSYQAVATRGEQGRLRAGQHWHVGELLYPLLLESSNDAAEALAEHIDHYQFMETMNGTAQAIGMTDTHFNDPSGLSIGNSSTAQDLFRLARHIYTYKSYIFNIAQLPRYSLKGTTWYNNNPYRNDDEFLGGKNGLTSAAGHTLLTVLDAELANGERRNLAFVVLKSDDEDRDTRLLQSYVRRHVEFTPFEK